MGKEHILHIFGEGEPFGEVFLSEGSGIDHEDPTVGRNDFV